MELRHLEHFVAVAEEESFTRAAARVHLVQSALSVSIRALERELGARLFDRTTHSVRLSDAGQALLPEARRTLAAADAARDAVAAVHGGLRGTVRIGIMRALSLIDLAALLTEFHRTRPQVRLVPSTPHGGSTELTNDVLDGRLDVAFAAQAAGYPAGLSALRLASEELMLACPPGHPFGRRRQIALSELADAPFVEFPQGWATRQRVDQLFIEHRIQREVAVEVDDIPTALDLVRAGFGYTLVAPSTVPDGHRRALRRVRPCGDFTVSLITPTQRQHSAAVRAFVDLVRTTYPADGGTP